ncbi:MAG: hypothetical protein R6X22_14035 [Gemmatimonadota bacterium]
MWSLVQMQDAMHDGGHWFGMQWGWWLFLILIIGFGIWFVIRSTGSRS